MPLSWREMFLAWPSVAWFYFRQLVIPIGISGFHSIAYLDHPTLGGFWIPLLLAGCLLLVGWGWGSTRKPKQLGPIWLAAILMTLPLLPVFDLRALTAGDVVHERYLYLPSVGYVIFIALALCELEDRLKRAKPSLSGTALATTGAIAVLFVALTLTQQRQWSSDIALYTRGIVTAPDNLTVRDNLANALLATGQPARAIAVYQEVLSRNPNFWRSSFNLGVAYYRSGNEPAAEQSLEQAIRVDNRDSDQYIYLALVKMQMKRLSEAKYNAREAVARSPEAPGYHLILGLIAEASADENTARDAFRTELKLHPDNSAARQELQKIRETASSSTH